MKKPLLFLVYFFLLAALFGCKKSDSDSKSQIGQLTSDERVVIGTLDEKGKAIFMPKETIEAAFNSTFTSLVVHKVIMSKNASDQFQLIIESRHTKDNTFITMGFNLEQVIDEIVLATDQCMHSCSTDQSGCGCALTFSNCEGSCSCSQSSDLHCNHIVSSGAVPLKDVGFDFATRSIGDFTKKLASNS